MELKNKIVIGLCCLASIASAQEVVTLGTFGFVKNAHTNTYHISGMQFDNSPSNTPTIVYGDTLPKGSKIYVWDGGYTIAEYNDVYVPGQGLVTKWDIDPELGNGQGYWVEVPSTTNATLSGDVPMADAVTNSISIGLQLCSYPYPVDRVVTNLGFTPSKGDKIYDWSGGYVITEYNDVFVPGQGLVTKWNNETLPIAVGKGFWYESVANTNWIATKPY